MFSNEDALALAKICFSVNADIPRHVFKERTSFGNQTVIDKDPPFWPVFMGNSADWYKQARNLRGLSGLIGPPDNREYYLL